MSHFHYCMSCLYSFGTCIVKQVVLHVYIVSLFKFLFVQIQVIHVYWFRGVMVFSAIFNNISVILWRLVLLVEDNRSTRRKTTDLPQVTNNHYHITLYRVHLAWSEFEHTTLVMICSCKSNYHIFTTTTTRYWFRMYESGVISRSNIKFTTIEKIMFY
jgi:hypothetical protein